jgi:hypothetical protein
MPQPDHLRTLKKITNSTGITLLVLDREKNLVSIKEQLNPNLDPGLPYSCSRWTWKASKYFPVSAS